MKVLFETKKNIKKEREWVTFEEPVECIGPVAVVALVAGLVPDEGALDVALWWHRPETQSGVVADQRAFQLPFRLIGVQRLVEHGQHAAEEACQHDVKDHVEQQDLSWNITTVN